MPKSYSGDLRERVIEAVEHLTEDDRDRRTRRSMPKDEYDGGDAR